jgi:translation initiation factor 3 subunit K
MAPPSESEMRSLLASQTYSASSLPVYEAYLAAQVSGNAPYIFDAVRTLVKLYQLFPEKKNEVNIGHCCMLALSNYPETDLLALSYMIPTSTFTTEPMATIQKCSEQLDACNFIEFWKTFAVMQQSSDAAIKGMANSKSMEGKLQGAILSTLALSYKEAPASVVLTALNVTSVNAVTALKNPTVESITADTVVFLASQDNTKRKRVYQEGVNFTAISSLMAKMGQ